MPINEQAASTAARQNYVIVYDKQEQMASTLAALQRSAPVDKFSLLVVGWSDWVSQTTQASATRLLQALLTEIQARLAGKTPILWYRQPGIWLQKRAANRQLATWLSELAQVPSNGNLELSVGQQPAEIKALFSRLNQEEGREYTLVVLADYQMLPHNQQPEIATFIHKLLWESQGYYRILSSGQPALLHMGTGGPVGIEVDQDYRLVNVKADSGTDILRVKDKKLWSDDARWATDLYPVSPQTGRATVARLKANAELVLKVYGPNKSELANGKKSTQDGEVNSTVSLAPSADGNYTVEVSGPIGTAYSLTVTIA